MTVAIDKYAKTLCTISNETGSYQVQRVVNKGGDIMYVAVESNHPEDEVFSCYEADLGNMLTHIVTVSLLIDDSRE